MKEKDKTVAVLFSSGIDSLACLVWACLHFRKENIIPVYVDLGHRYAAKEIAAARALLNEFSIASFDGPTVELSESPIQLRVINATDIYYDSAHFVSYLPFRNQLLLDIAVVGCQPDIVVYGALTGQASTDKTKRFINSLQRVYDIQHHKDGYDATKKVSVIAPFIEMTKTEVIRWMYEQDENEYVFKDFSRALSMTVGCYSASDEECGVCNACINRWIAFYNSNGYEVNLNKLEIPISQTLLFSAPNALLLDLENWIKGKKRSSVKWNGLSISRWFRLRRTLYEKYSALDKYCKEQYRVSLLQYCWNEWRTK